MRQSLARLRRTVQPARILVRGASGLIGAPDSHRHPDGRGQYRSSGQRNGNPHRGGPRIFLYGGGVNLQIHRQVVVVDDAQSSVVNDGLRNVVGGRSRQRIRTGDGQKLIRFFRQPVVYHRQTEGGRGGALPRRENKCEVRHRGVISPFHGGVALRPH